jgi:hypothetical protein
VFQQLTYRLPQHLRPTPWERAHMVPRRRAAERPKASVSAKTTSASCRVLIVYPLVYSRSAESLRYHVLPALVDARPALRHPQADCGDCMSRAPRRHGNRCIPLARHVLRRSREARGSPISPEQQVRRRATSIQAERSCSPVSPRTQAWGSSLRGGVPSRLGRGSRHA